ncbi:MULTISPECIES: hypothetical protein [Streptomyces]|uniref:Uncharacterized protein n=1 Tax=Streptomyces venezuelae TaxID=54571 RepID=A0A5P2BCK1_STRVZ|nr:MULTISPECIES: hypothetical protein [Streptomyces]NEA05363.1 hypothetical protein [Streptomyces sp. SID10116]MYY81212.1 hypothetical protein [Streptomyces sp. SID335]MYZ15989.1 hypothetical protein [Streptomyces sp. SID337]NDZ90609.1 hypothetical protein [Streptomyces sp. SID10115]NEB48628.1 hypothetical protein [Streptomyces sp. SID339]
MSRITRFVLHEWRSVVATPCRRLRERGPLGVSLAVFACVAVIGLHEFQQTAAGAGVVRVLSEVRADQPVWLTLLRTPVSLFVPAVDLPAWGGLPRLFLAFALAELLFGRVRTLVVAYAVTLAGTLGARVMIALGPGRLGVPAEAAHTVDTGASAAIVGLFAYTAVAVRSPLLFLAAVVPTVTGSIAELNLAGREHLIAVAVAMVLGIVSRGDRCQWPLPGSRAPDQHAAQDGKAGDDGEAGQGDSRRRRPAGHGRDGRDPQR